MCIIYTTFMFSPQKSEEGVVGATDGCELPRERWEPLEEQSVRLLTKRSSSTF